jgi:hypothetical protein
MVSLLEVRQDLRDDFGLLDAGNDPELPTTAGAGVDLDAKDALQALRPAHRHVARGFRLVRVTDLIGSLPLAPHTPMRRRHRSAQLAVRGEHSMKSCQVHARWRHQCGKTRHQVQRVPAARFRLVVTHDETPVLHH